jgi:small ubiquitin-related modifier
MGEEADPNTITLRVRDQHGDEMFFKVKKDTKMSKIMDAYAQRKGISATSLRFTMDGDRIDAHDTPKMLELEENDQIDVMLETVGGNQQSVTNAN